MFYWTIWYILCRFSLFFPHKTILICFVYLVNKIKIKNLKLWNLFLGFALNSGGYTHVVVQWYVHNVPSQWVQSVSIKTTNARAVGDTLNPSDSLLSQKPTFGRNLSCTDILDRIRWHLNSECRWDVGQTSLYQMAWKKYKRNYRVETEPA